LIDNIFAYEINCIIYLIFDETEVVIDRFLQHSAFGFNSVV